MTFDELASFIRDYTIRDELTDAQIAGFVRLLEAKLRTQIHKHRLAETTVEITASVTTGAAQLPADFKELRSIQHEGRPLSLTSVEARTKCKGTPTSYFLSGDRIALVPPPASSGKVSVVYYAHLPALTVTRPTNWVSLNFPDTYLHGALAEAFAFLGNDAALAQQKGLLAEALATIAVDHSRAVFSGGALPIPRGL